MAAAVLDLTSCFSDGMVYVALSRVRFMEIVRVLSFARSRVLTDHRVAFFYDNQQDVGHEDASCLDMTR